MNSDREGRAPGEPPNGDFVAYLEDIERRQLAEMNRPHALAHPSPQGGAQVEPVKPLSRDEVRALLERLRVSRAALPLSAGSLLMMIVGALALANALFGDGGIIAFAIGVALLWRPIRRLIAAARPPAPSAPRPQDAVNATFGESKAKR